MSTEMREVLVATNDLSVARLVTATLAGDPRFGSPVTCRDLHDLASRLEQRPALAAVVDIDPHPAGSLADLEMLAARFTDTRFVLLTSQPSNDLILEAMQIGARHLLDKAAVAAQLSGILARLVPTAISRSTAHGQVYTVLGTSGGCGATMLATNLAQELRLANPDKPALLIDLDAGTGGAATALGAKASYGITDVLDHPGAPDPQLIRSSAAVCPGGLHMLLSPASIDFISPARLAYESLARTLTACRMAYPYTVVDAARVPISAAASLAASSQVTLIVLQLNVRDIRLARLVRQALVERAVPQSRVRLVVNRYRKHYSMVSLEDAQQALGEMDLALLANDYAAASRSQNLGEPLAKTAPASPLRKDICRLVDQLTVEAREHDASPLHA
jgi:pilus assembly protein CpaE